MPGIKIVLIAEINPLSLPSALQELGFIHYQPKDEPEYFRNRGVEVTTELIRFAENEPDMVEITIKQYPHISFTATTSLLQALNQTAENILVKLDDLERKHNFLRRLAARDIDKLYKRALERSEEIKSGINLDHDDY